MIQVGGFAGRVEAIVEYRDALDALCDAAEFAELPVNTYTSIDLSLLLTIFLSLQVVVW